jgi:hypothetical protein
MPPGTEVAALVLDIDIAGEVAKAAIAGEGGEAKG